jgi:hypothetical protein
MLPGGDIAAGDAPLVESTWGVVFITAMSCG